MGYTAPVIGTGYESVIGQRNSGMFCYTAKQAGRVVELKQNAIIVEYADKSRDHIEIGRIFGKAAGLIIPHDIVTDLKPGQKFNPGDAIAYHNGFFEEDIYNPGRVVMKIYTLARTVLWESDTTFEDASCISRELGSRLATKTTKVKNITVKFDDVVSDVVKVGQNVDFDSVLCVIQDRVSAQSGAFTDATLQTLRMIDSQTPKAGVLGVVDKVEVFYHGILDDMSDSLQKLARAFNSDLKRRQLELNKPVYTGQVDGSFRIEGDPLEFETACIRVYLTVENTCSVGDKGVFANQMKTVYSGVTEEGQDYYSEDGDIIDAIFGGRSIDARIVTSAPDVGIATSTVIAIEQAACRAYFDE